MCEKFTFFFKPNLHNFTKLNIAIHFVLSILLLTSNFIIMKNLFYSLFISFLFIGCSSAQTNPAQTNPERLINFWFTATATMVSAVNGCYTVNVVINYHDESGQVWQFANQNVQVGTNCTRVVSGSTKCKDILYKGDYIIGSDKPEYKDCLVDYLKDEVTYAKYVISREKAISDFLKK